MKIKVKYSSTKKFVLNIENEQIMFGELKERITNFVLDTYNEDIRKTITISLNGRDPLEGDDTCMLTAVGIVAGDLITILTDVAGKKEKLMANESLNSSNSTAHQTPKANHPSVPILEEHLPKDSIVTQCFDKYKPSSVNEAINIVTHTTMVKKGFAIDTCDGELPANWKDMVATFKYKHTTLNGFESTVVIVTMGEVKQILASFPGQQSEISTRVTSKDYIKPFHPSDTIVLKNLIKVNSLSHTIFNHILYPLQVAAHEALGVPAPWHISGLPSELLLELMSFLDVKSVLNLGLSCKRLMTVSKDNKLWCNLYNRDFRASYKTKSDTCANDWKSQYIAAHLHKKEEEKRREEMKNCFREDFDPLRNPPMRLPRPPPNPYAPNPFFPDGPIPNLNPFSDPDSPHFQGELPSPYGPFGPILRHPFPTPPRFPNDPFTPPSMHLKPNKPRGPRFDFI